jgi:hypothetical protein
MARVSTTLTFACALYRCFDLGNGILGGAHFSKGVPGVRWQNLMVCNGIPDG